MPGAVVTRPFTAYLVLEGVERRLEAGERIAAEELALWGRSVDHLVSVGRIALVDETAAGEQSVKALVDQITARAGELGAGELKKLKALLPARGGRTADGDGASVAGGDPGGDPPAPAAPSPSPDPNGAETPAPEGA